MIGLLQLLESGMSVMDIHREVGYNTIYVIKKELNFSVRGLRLR